MTAYIPQHQSIISHSSKNNLWLNFKQTTIHLCSEPTFTWTQQRQCNSLDKSLVHHREETTNQNKTDTENYEYNLMELWWIFADAAAMNHKGCTSSVIVSQLSQLCHLALYSRWHFQPIKPRFQVWCTTFFICSSHLPVGKVIFA